MKGTKMAKKSKYKLPPMPKDADIDEVLSRIENTKAALPKEVTND
jgi:hypothetical protein